MTGTTE